MERKEKKRKEKKQQKRLGQTRGPCWKEGTWGQGGAAAAQRGTQQQRQEQQQETTRAPGEVEIDTRKVQRGRVATHGKSF